MAPSVTIHCYLWGLCNCASKWKGKGGLVKARIHQRPKEASTAQVVCPERVQPLGVPSALRV